MERQNTSVIQKLSISYECALAIGNSLNLSEMLHDVIHTIVHKTNAHRGSIWLRGEKKGENIKLGARAGSLLTKAEIKKRTSSFQSIFEKIWKDKRPVIKNRGDKDFFQYCFKITGKEQSVLIVPVKNVAILKLVYTNKEIVNETLANMLLSLSERLSIAINACLAHENIKREIQIRKETEQDLLDSEKKYRTLIETMEEGIGIIDEKENFTFVNQATANILGYSKKELLGKNLKELTTPEEFQRVLEQTSIRKTGKSSKYEFSILKKDGEKRTISVSATPKFGDNGKFQGTFGIFHDITEQKQAEEKLKSKSEQIISDKEKIEGLYKNSEENRKSLLSILEDTAEKERDLRESEERFQNIVANTGDWIWETDTKGRYTYCSPIIKQVLGYEYQEMLGKHFYDFFVPEEREELKKSALEVFKKKKVFKNFTNRNVHKDGHIVILETSGVPILDDKGNLLGYRGVDRDITERKRAEQTRSVLYNIADAVNTTKDLDELFKTIHKQLSTIIDTTNYYVALYDKETDTISLPYDVDQKDRFTSFPAGKTFTAYVIKTGKSLLADEEVSEKLTQAGEVETVGTPSKIWLGVPLKIANEVIGVVVVQSYTDASLYTEKDLAILEFVSDQIAIAIEHQRADEAIKESEEKFRSVVENSHEGIIIVGKDYRFIYVNDELCQILGYPDEEIIGQDFRKFLDEDSKKLVSDRYIRRQRGEDIPHRYEFNIMRKDGKKRQVEISSSIIKDSKGEIFTVAQILDITERKQAEKLQATIYKIADAINTTTDLDELYQTIHQHLSTVIDTTNFYIAFYDEDKDILSFPYYIDEKDTQPVSYKPSKGLTEYVMRTGKSLFAPKEYYMELVKEGKIEVVGSLPAVWLGIPLRIEKKIIGVIAVQSYTDASLYNENDLAILEFVSDQIAIAIERKRAEEARRKSEKHFSDTIENIFKFVPDSLLVFTDKLNLFSENKAFQDIIQKYAAKLNYTESELKKIITEQIKNKILKKDHTEIRISKKYDK